MLRFGLALPGTKAYMTGSHAATKFAVIGSLKKLAIEVRAEMFAVWNKSRLVDFDFATMGIVALNIAAIKIVADRVIATTVFLS